MYFENTKALWTAISLVLLVLFYLLRPKSKEILFTSMMFLTEQKKTVQKRVIESFNKNVFFYLQFAIIVLLVLSAASPVIERINEEKEKKILILDISASMSISEVFEELIKITKENLGEINTIILAENVPILLAEKRGSAEIKEYLNEIKPKYTRTNLRNALNYAIELSKKDKYQEILLISDFLTKEKIDDLLDYADEEGIRINEIKIENKRDNIGIIAAVKNEKEGKIDVVVKNYGENKGIEIISNEEKIKTELEKGEKKKISLNWNTDKIELTPKDDFAADNIFFISQNNLKKNTAVIISDVKDKFLEAALEANDFNVRYEKPPIINANADLIIFDDTNYERLVPGTWEDVEKKASEGKEVVFNFAEKMPKTDILPLEIKTLEQEQESKVKLDKLIFKDFEDVKITKKYFAELKKNSIVIAKDEKETPIIVYEKKGKGIIVYNGLAKEYIKNSPDYPLFWKEIIKLGGKEINKNNYKTGEFLSFDEQVKIKTPSGEINSNNVNSILLDEIGIYEIKGDLLAVNLLSEEESDFTTENVASSFDNYASTNEIKRKNNTPEAINQRKTDKIRMEKNILLIAVSLLMFELYFAFKRGII